MKWNKSKIILVVEFVLIVLPVSVLFSFGSYFLMSTAIKYPEIGSIVNAAFSVAAAFSISAVYILGYRVLNEKTSRISEKPFLWVLIAIGALIVASSVVSEIIPPSPPYFLLWNIRQDFEHFILGAPLIIVAVHLYYENHKR